MLKSLSSYGAFLRYRAWQWGARWTSVPSVASTKHRSRPLDQGWSGRSIEARCFPALNGWFLDWIFHDRKPPIFETPMNKILYSHRYTAIDVKAWKIDLIDITVYPCRIWEWYYGQALRVAPKVQMAFKNYPSTCSKTCAGPVSWNFPNDEP